MENAQQKYERYRRVFAETQGIPVEKATEYQAVKTYKIWLEEKNGVVIDEKV